jgi:TetR/AcrR family transcriptional regulator, transcriptional repressor of bet genes
LKSPPSKERTPARAPDRTPATAKPRFVRQLPEQRRQALIAATIECLKRFGHDGLSIRTISAQAGVSVGLINHHFPNKDELVAAAYRHFNSELVAGFQAAVERAPHNPRARLHAFFRAQFSLPNLDPDVLAVWVVFWGMYRHSRLIQRVHRETYQGYVQLVRGMLAELLPAPSRARGRRGVDLRMASIGLTALLDGLWLEWCLEPGTFRPAEAIAVCEAWIGSLRAR